MSVSTAPRLPDRPAEADEWDLRGGMRLLDHLEELRRRLLIAILSLLAGFVVACTFVSRVFDAIMRPLQDALEGGKLIYTEPAEAFLLQLKVAALVGLLMALPVVMAQVWLFVAPGLHRREKRFAVPFVVLATLSFATGAAFAHFVVFPWSWNFFAGFSTDFMRFTPKVDAAFSLYVRLLLAFGAIFQMPSIVLVLARLGLVTPRFLLRHFKYAVLVAFVAAAIITPTPDVVTQLLMAGPIILLYLFSVLVAWVFARRRHPGEGDEP